MAVVPDDTGRMVSVLGTILESKSAASTGSLARSAFQADEVASALTTGISATTSRMMTARIATPARSPAVRFGEPPRDTSRLRD